MIPPWGSHTGMLYFLGRDKDMWHTCGDTVHPYQFEAFCFLFHGWYLTFCCLIPTLKTLTLVFSFETFSGPWPLRKPSLSKGKIWRKLSWNLADGTTCKDATHCWQAFSLTQEFSRGNRPFLWLWQGWKGWEHVVTLKRSPKNTGSLNFIRTCWARWQWKTPRHGAMSELRTAESLKSIFCLSILWWALCIPQLFYHPWQELSTTCVHQMLGLPW